MKTGDRAFFYHTGKEKAVVGEMIVAGEPKSDPKGDEAAVVVAMKPVKKLAKPVPLATIKADKILAKWDLVRLPRLSVVPVTEAQWKRVVELSLTQERKPD
jgi:predicted RNA-binding protein with PUA-like domain